MLGRCMVSVMAAWVLWEGTAFTSPRERSFTWRAIDGFESKTECRDLLTKHADFLERRPLNSALFGDGTKTRLP
jgi:hypothetical protein